MLSREAMIALKLAGLTYQAIAERTGVSRQRVQQVLAPPPAIAGKVRQASQGLCGQCGKLIGSHGHIHHQGNTSDKWDTLSQLAYLCIACHRGVHRVYPPLNCPVCDKPLNATANITGYCLIHRPLKHGSHTGYVNHRCRCVLCVAWNTWRHRISQATRRGKEPPVHGTRNGYGNYGCRCKACTVVHVAACRVYKAVYRARKKQQTLVVSATGGVRWY